MQDSPIDQFFRSAQETEPYIKDGGFSEKVRLEIQQRQLLAMVNPSIRPMLILLLATLLGSFTFYRLSPVELWISEILVWLNSGLILFLACALSLIFALIASLLLATDRL